MNTLICSRCKKERTLDHFHKKNDVTRGFSYWCKDCCCRYHMENPNKIYKNRWNKEHMKLISLSSRNWAKKNPVKRWAEGKLYRALMAGRVIKLPCEVCGDIKVQAHHPNYAKPLEVIWLCINHHRMVHTRKLNINYNQKDY